MEPPITWYIMHAFSNRIEDNKDPLMESLFCLVRRRIWEETQTKFEGPPPEFEPEYTDDGFSGDTLSSIWASFE